MIENLLGRFRRPANIAKASKRRSRRRRELEQLRRSELFDPAWYLESYPDVRDSGVDPVLHYLESGWREGRDPGPAFCTSAYLRANADVAAAKVNPLLHYLVHGNAEGRGALDHASPLRALVDPLQLFGPAAPCARFPVPDPTARRWIRAGRIPKQENSILVRGVTIGLASEDLTSEAVDDAFRLLAWLSGCCSDQPADTHLSAGEPMRLLDAWHAGHGILRTRWVHSASTPTVVRSVQHLGDEPELVGEGCVAGTLDFVDVEPRNPFFPILFLFTDPEGLLCGLRLLVFPALWRGGLYYPELAALATAPLEGAPLDIGGTDEWLAGRLIALRRGSVRALVAATVVLLDNADGTHPLFRSGYRTWLARVMQMPLEAADPPNDRTSAYLTEAIELLVTAGRRNGLARLKIAGDMIPSLSVLTESAFEGALSQELVGSLIAASEDPASPSTYLDVPAGMPAASLPGRLGALPSLAPCTGSDGLAPEVGLLAIRAPAKRKLSEAELLVPDCSADASAELGSATSWVIWPEQWGEEQLATSLQSLALQTTGVPTVIFVGRPRDPAFEIARRLFAAKLVITAGIDAAIEAIHTEFAGYIGPGTIVHDPNTAAILTSLLSRSEAITMSAPLVSATSNGKVAKGLLADLVGADELELLKGATVPVAKLPFHFFISRTEIFSKLARGAAITGQHYCSTRVSVSLVDGGIDAPAPFGLPEPVSAISMRPVIG